MAEASNLVSAEDKLRVAGDLQERIVKYRAPAYLACTLSESPEI